MYEITIYLPCLLTYFYNFSVYLISGTYVPNWSILRNYKEIKNSTKISVTLGIHLTQGGRVKRPLTCGPSGWSAGQTPWLAGLTLQPLVSFLGGDALQEAVEWNPRPGVGGGRAWWPAGHVARLIGQHLANYRLNQVGNCSWDSYKYPLPLEFNTPHYTCSSPLVKVPL
jgi:hypothetical protein